jgi:hypothetical protein
VVDVLNIVYWVPRDVQTGAHLREWGGSGRGFGGFSTSLDHVDRVAGLDYQLRETSHLDEAYRDLVRRDGIIILQYLSCLISYDSSHMR